MTPKKRRSSKAALKEEKLPEVAVDLVDEQGVETVEKAEESGETEKTEAQAQRKNQESKGEKIKQNINSIKEKEGVIGYILRNSKSASIDLKDPSKVIDYAILSSSAFETSEELSSILDLGQVNRRKRRQNPFYSKRRKQSNCIHGKKSGSQTHLQGFVRLKALLSLPSQFLGIMRLGAERGNVLG